MSRPVARAGGAALLALSCGLVMMPAARAEIVDLKWSEGTFAHKGSIAPKKFLEVCGKLGKGENVGWRFSGNAPTDFNIHYHVGKDVVYPEQRKEIAKADGTLAVPLDQDFCWMWTNRGTAALEIEVQLSKAPK